jgi:hypothetical protein
MAGCNSKNKNKQATYIQRCGKIGFVSGIQLADERLPFGSFAVL